jgi:hypothetical protein
MGFLTGNPPVTDPEPFLRLPYRERLKITSRHWIDYGFGSPKAIAVMYLLKLVVFFLLGGILVGTLTSHLNPLHPSQWFNQPIFYEKVIFWTVLLECIGVAGSWGPLAGHMWPFTGGWHYYSRKGALRNPPWPTKVPLTAGDDRTILDVALYLAVLAGLIVCLALPGVHVHGVDHHVLGNKGLVPPAAIVPTIALIGLLGLRDKIFFLAARSEQYIPAMVFMAFFPFVDMIVAAKLLIVIVWFCAGLSKCNRHFTQVIAPMVANVPWIPLKSIKRMHVNDVGTYDLRPSRFTHTLAHGPGMFGELVPPLVLLFSHNHIVTVCAAVFMIAYHLFIISTFPLAVPLEWNVVFMYITAFLFLGYPNQGGYGLGEMGPGVLIPTAVVMLFFPIMGNARPDWISFLPSLRQYGGNWASAMWAFAPGCEEKIDSGAIRKSAKVQKQQLQVNMPLLGYSEPEAEMTLQMFLGWRSMHSQGRGLNSVMMNQLGEDIDFYTLREAEFMCNAIAGFNFGEGHFHDKHLIAAIQKRCKFAPGEFIVVWVESDPVYKGRQEYWVYDAAVGVVESGSWSVKDAVEAINWLPDGPIPVKVDFRMPGYERVRYPSGGGRTGSPVRTAPAVAA